MACFLAPRVVTFAAKQVTNPPMIRSFASRMQICRQMHAVIHCRLILREQTANDNASLEMTHRHVGDAGAFSVCRNISRDSGIRRINLYNDTVTGVLLKYSDPVVGGLELSGFGRRRDRRVFCCSYFHRGASVHAGPRCLGRRTIYSTHTHTHTRIIDRAA